MRRKSRLHGSTLIMALVTMSVTAFAAWSVLYIIGNRAKTISDSGSWQESMDVAESGVDTAMAALNNSLSSPSTWVGWKLANGTVITSSNASTYAATYPKYYTGTLAAHAGDGNNKMYVNVSVDNSFSNPNGYYRIRSKGTTELPGLRRMGYAPSARSSTGAKDHLSFLRKLSFTADATGGALNVPQVTRSIETLAQPVGSSLFTRALLLQNSISMSGGAYTDSFDSSNPLYSTNGQYDSSKRENHGDIAVNATGNNSDLKNATVYGNVSSNGGTIKDTKNVQGTVYNNFSATISTVSDPTFTASSGTPAIINGTATLTAGTAASPTNVVVSSLNVPGGTSLTLTPPSAGQESYVNIWVKGDMTTSGSGFIKQLAGVHATIYVDGNVTVSGGAFDNENGYAAYLQINGVTPSNGTTRTYTVSGSAEFIGVVNAPAYSLTVSGSGDYIGAIIALDATLSGSAGVHYDQSLSSIGGGNGQGYKVASWIEDIH